MAAAAAAAPPAPRSSWWEGIAAEWAASEEETKRAAAERQRLARAWLARAAADHTVEPELNEAIEAEAAAHRQSAKGWVAGIAERERALRAEVGAEQGRRRAARRARHAAVEATFREEARRNDLNVLYWDAQQLGITFAFKRRARPAGCETAVLPHRPLPLLGVSIGMERECHRPLPSAGVSAGVSVGFSVGVSVETMRGVPAKDDRPAGG